MKRHLGDDADAGELLELAVLKAFRYLDLLGEPAEAANKPGLVLTIFRLLRKG